MKIKSIKNVSPRLVYAIQTSTGTFIADGLAHHNCVKCNQHNSGELDLYAERLIAEYGLEWFNQLVKDAWCHQGYSVSDLKAIIEDLKIKISNL